MYTSREYFGRSSPPQQNLRRFYTATNFITNDGKETRIESLSSTFADTPITLILEKDGTAKLKSDDTTSDIQWEESSDGIIVFEKDNTDNATAYTFKDGYLYQDYGIGEMKLEKK